KHPPITTVVDLTATTVADSTATTVADSRATTVADSTATTVADSRATTVADSTATTVADSTATTVADSTVTVAKQTNTVLYVCLQDTHYSLRFTSLQRGTQPMSVRTQVYWKAFPPCLHVVKKFLPRLTS
ncbi:hypothetical protein FHG87_023765, partial [Trinorchestia longiramus]